MLAGFNGFGGKAPPWRDRSSTSPIIGVRAMSAADLARSRTTKESTFAVALYWYGLVLHEDGEFRRRRRNTSRI